MPVRSPRQALLPLQFNEELAMLESATDHISTDFVVTHPLDAEDTAITAAMRAMVSSTKGVSRGIEARGQFDAIMESVLPRDDVTIEVATLGRHTGNLGTSCELAVGRGDYPSARWLVQLWIRQGLSPSCRAYCRKNGSEGVHPGLSACPRTSLPGRHRRRAGMLSGACRERRSPDCAHGRFRRRQSRTRTRLARHRRSRLHRCDPCRGCRVVAGDRRRCDSALM